MLHEQEIVPSKGLVSVDWEAQAHNNPAVGGAVVLGSVVVVDGPLPWSVIADTCW